MSAAITSYIQEKHVVITAVQF